MKKKNTEKIGKRKETKEVVNQKSKIKKDLINEIEISNEKVILYHNTITLQVEKLSEVEDCRAQKLIGRP